MSVSYGARLRAERERKGLSIRALADEVGCDKSSIVGWEQDKRQPTAIYEAKLARCLGGSLLDDIFPATPAHLELKPDTISEADWRSELQHLYESWLQILGDQTAGGVPRFPTPDIEVNAAVLARQSQLWGHEVVPHPFRGGPSYKLTTDDQGRKVWESNVRENVVEEVDGELEKGTP